MRRFRRCLILAALKATKRNCQQRTLTHRIERTQSQCALTPFNAFVRLAIMKRRPHFPRRTSERRTGSPREPLRALVRRFSIVRHEGQDKSSNRQCDGVITAISDRLISVSGRADTVFIVCSAASEDNLVRKGCIGMGECVVGFHFHGAFS